MTNYKAKKKEKARFFNLLAGLKAAQGSEEKGVYVAFIHTLVNTPKDLDVRISIRGEFVKLGFLEILKVFFSQYLIIFFLETQI